MAGTDEEVSRGRPDDEAAAADKGGGKQGGREKDGGYWAEEEVSGGGPREGTAQLDKEVILTMLGDLEQVLHTQPRPRKFPPILEMTQRIVHIRHTIGGLYSFEMRGFP